MVAFKPCDVIAQEGELIILTSGGSIYFGTEALSTTTSLVAILTATKKVNLSELARQYYKDNPSSLSYTADGQKSFAAYLTREGIAKEITYTTFNLWDVT